MALLRTTVTCLALLALVATEARADRLKDLADLKGARDNQLIGYGLVVGLAGTGDRSTLSTQSVVNMLRRLGAHVDTSNLRLPNVAAVMVTAELPAYSAPGQRLDVMVSSIANADSLQGGTLIATPLKGADSKVYAVAQGPLSIGGFAAGGQSGSSVSKNHATVGRIPNGAIIERAVPIEVSGAEIEINLHTPDFTTAVRVADAIDYFINPRLIEERAKAAEKAAAEAKRLAEEQAAKKNKRGRRNGVGNNPEPEQPPQDEAADLEQETEGEAIEAPERYARARDAGTVMVLVPERFSRRLPELMATLEAIQVTPDNPTRVVINERTGTVILGASVRILPVAIAHGGLSIEVSEFGVPSQPAPLSKGETVVVPNSRIEAVEATADLAISGGASLSEVVQALNSLGVSPRDLVAILQGLKTAGALRAELEIQ